MNINTELATVQIIEIINRVFASIEYYTKKGMCVGICTALENIDYNEINCAYFITKFRALMSDRMNRNFGGYWWYSGEEKFNTPITEWYAPRIEFLKQWKHDLSN